MNAVSEQETTHINSKAKLILFPLGRVVATPGALELMDRMTANGFHLLQRHQTGDWGNVPADDAIENDFSVVYGNRILSSYPLGKENIWIITEADRSSTTLLLPDEY